MILYYVPDAFSSPAGGIRVIYRHVDILNRNGVEAAVLHHVPGFRLDWFVNDTRIEYIPEIVAAPNDIVVLPEGFAPQAATVFSGLRKVIFNQNCYYTFVNYPLGYTDAYAYNEVLAVITASDEGKQYLEFAFPGCAVHSVGYSIDPDLYYCDFALKKRQIAFMPRKNVEDVKQVVAMLRLRGVTCPMTLIHDVSQEEAARHLRESEFFMSFGHPEGFGLPAAEAMACGCKVAGYHGMGGREFFREPYAIPVEFGDIVQFTKVVEGLLTGERHVDVEAAMDLIRTRYSPEKETESLLRAWERILAL